VVAFGCERGKVSQLLFSEVGVKRENDSLAIPKVLKRAGGRILMNNSQCFRFLAALSPVHNSLENSQWASYCVQLAGERPQRFRIANTSPTTDSMSARELGSGVATAVATTLPSLEGTRPPSQNSPNAA